MSDQTTEPRRRRRVIAPAPDGVDPTPSDHALTSDASEDRPEAWGDAPRAREQATNDEQLTRDRPPHWG